MKSLLSFIFSEKRTNLRSNKRTHLILETYYPFYLKLASGVRERFLDKVEISFTKLKFKFSNTDDYENFKYQLLCSAEVTRYLMGINKCDFDNFPTIAINVIHDEKHEGLPVEVFDGTVLIHWELFLESLQDTKETGLATMVIDSFFQKKLAEVEPILKSSFLNLRTVSSRKNKLFSNEDVMSQDSFFKACFRSYFSRPNELRNIHPNIYRQVDTTLFRSV